MRKVRCLSATFVVLAMMIASSVRAQVMEMMPSNAMVVIKIKNIQDVSAKVAMLSQQWGLANIRPELNDPLGTLLTAANLGPGLNKAGDAAIAIMKPEAGEHEPGMVMMISVSDYKTFAAALPNAKAEGDLTTFSMGGNPKPGYVADWGKYAAISPSKEMISKKGGGIAVSAAFAKELDSKDVIAYANFKEIRKEVLPMLAQNKPMILGAIEQGMMNAPGANPKFAPVMKAYIAQFFAVFEGLLQDADGASFGVNLSKEGISTTLMADFTPDSYSGKAVKALKNTDASFTAGLPDGKYFVYGGMVIDESGLKLFNDFVAPIEKEIAATGADGKAINDYIASVKTYMASAKQANFGMVAPPANAFGKEGIIQVVSVVKGDSAKLLAAQKDMLATENEMMKLTGAGGLGMKFTSTPNAKTVDGVTLDKFAATFEGQPATPQEQQMLMIIKMVYGPNGLSGYVGATGPDQVIGVVGGGEELLAAAVKSAKTNSDDLAKGPAAKVIAGLPQNRIAAFYLQIDTIATTVLDVMAARGMPGGVKLPPNLPPLAGAIDTDGTAIRADGYIPAQTVQSLIAAGMQMWLQNMQGGGQPGGL